MISRDTTRQRPLPNVPTTKDAWPLGAWVRHILLVGLLAGASAGIASALFLFLLATATEFRCTHAAIVWALPVAGWALGACFSRCGGRSLLGSNLVIDTHFDLGAQLPRRMAPLVLFGTVATHLFGGSAGREGTAVQMGASLADAWAHLLRATGSRRQDWLRAGVAAGFGAVFGTPWAAMVFAHEFFGGRFVTKTGLISAAIAAVTGDQVCRQLGAHHLAFPQLQALPMTPLLLGKWVLFSLATTLAVHGFVSGVHAVKALSTRFVPQLPWRMALGGAFVVSLWQLGIARDSFGLGADVIQRSFTDPTLSPNLFAEKILLTALTVGTGFLGGEVTPLFLVGASIGNALAPLLDFPLSMSAAVGMSALFAGAANVPLAVAIMAVELFGFSAAPHVLFVSVLTCTFRGRNKLYGSQHNHPLSSRTILDR